MELPVLTAQDEKFINLIRRVRGGGAISYLIAASVCVARGAPKGFFDFGAGYTQSDCKWAIKSLRRLQREHPEFAATYGDAASYIRTEWMRRTEVPADVKCDSAVAFEQIQPAGKVR